MKGPSPMARVSDSRNSSHGERRAIQGVHPREEGTAIRVATPIHKATSNQTTPKGLKDRRDNRHHQRTQLQAARRELADRHRSAQHGRRTQGY